MAEQIVTDLEIREIPGYEGYGVSQDGRVYSRWRLRHRQGGVGNESFLGEWIEKKTRVGPNGYIIVEIRMRSLNKFLTRYVHHLVLLAFVGQKPDGCEACHNDGDRQNNTVSNLRWDTRSSNHFDKRRHGTMNWGERCNQSKLKEHEVIEIRRLHSTGLSFYRIARMFKVAD